MDKFSRILVIIFILAVFNLAISLFVFNKINLITSNQDTNGLESLKVEPQAKTKATDVESSTTQSDLNTIKAELRLIRESLELTATSSLTPAP